jgi:hypothetical protein
MFTLRADKIVAEIQSNQFRMAIQEFSNGSTSAYRYKTMTCADDERVNMECFLTRTIADLIVLKIEFNKRRMFE